MALLLVSIGIVMGVIADVFLKKSQIVDWRLTLGGLLYGLAAVPVWMAYKRASFAWIAIAWQALSLSLSLFVGLTIFGETLTPKRLAALAFALAAILVLQTEGNT